MPKIIALSNINHDDKPYEAGATFEVDDDVAAKLCACGAAELAGKAPKKKAEGGEQKPEGGEQQ